MTDLAVEEAIVLYVQDLHRQGLKASSCATSASELRSCFRAYLADPLSSMTPAKVQTVINGLADRVSRHTRRPLRKVTRRNYVCQARLLLAWCAAKDLLPVNPLDAIADEATATVQESPMSDLHTENTATSGARQVRAGGKP